MADEEDKPGAAQADCPQCEECVEGLPMWMGTFSDLVTLLLTFFVLLLSFAKTETSKYKAALGSIRDAFGGNVKKYGDVIVPGKSPDDSPTMIDSQEPVKPFPIDFLTSEGMLDKHEVNRSSEEDLQEFRETVQKYDLTQNVQIQEMNEGVKVELREKIFFKQGETAILETNYKALKSLTKLLKENNWVVYVKGHSAKGERSSTGGDTYELSSRRANIISKYLIQKGIKAENIISVSYGDSRPATVKGREASEQELASMNRFVSFTIRKRHLDAPGRTVSAQ